MIPLFMCRTSQFLWGKSIPPQARAGSWGFIQRIGIWR